MAVRQAAVLRRRHPAAPRPTAGSRASGLRGRDAIGAPASLILTALELEGLKERLDRHPWYRATFERFRARVDELDARRPKVPIAKGRAFFESCENCAARLTFYPYDQSSHVCPKCGREHHGEAFDLAWLRQFHDWLGKRLVEAGIVHQVTGDLRYAELVRHYLGHYVTHYREYPLANNLLGPTRLFQSTYLEAFWLVDVVAAFDLTRGSAAFSEGDLSGVRGLLYESAAVVRSYDEGRSNRQAFNNAGMGAVGLLYEDDDLISYVLSGPHGFEYHMRESVLEDGVWYEGENYHFATLDHTLNLAEMARHRGIDLYGGESGHGSLKPMFDGPLKVMLPDLTFPSRKDSWFGRGMEFHRHVYELGYARYRDERYGGLLANAYASGIDRGDLSWRTFLYLEPDLPEPQDARHVRQTSNERMPGTGVGVLRRDDGATYASLEYGRYGGGHGHPDRLHLTLFADGVHWLLDPGTGWYHVPELGWYRSTIAHNTVTVDGNNQAPREGRLVAFGSAGGFQAAQATVEGIAPGLAARRTLVLGDGFLFDVVDVLAEDGERQVDWSCHTVGRFEYPSSSGAGEASRASAVLGEGNGYEFLTDVKTIPVGSLLDVTARAGGASLRMLQLGRFTQAFRAKAPGVPGNEEWPLDSLIARRSVTGKERIATVWLWSAEHGDARFEAEGDHYILTLGDRRHTFYVSPFAGPNDVGLAISVDEAGDGSPEGAMTCAWFGLRSFALPAASMRADRAMPYGAVRRAGAEWVPELPADFGAVVITPQGERTRRFEQPPGVVISPEQDELLLFAGVPNDVRFDLAWYGRSPEPPEVELPDGWRLDGLEKIAAADEGGHLETWNMRVLLPPAVETEGSRARPADGHGAGLRVSAGGRSATFDHKVAAPLRASWRVGKHQGEPSVILRVTDMRASAGELHYELHAPWSGELLAGSVTLKQGGAAELALPLPPAAPVGAEARRAWPVSARVSSDGADMTFVTDLPLVWAGSRAGTVLLDDESQALWADRRWGGPEDVRAAANVALNRDDVSLNVRVWDDVHVVDGNLDDLYENDSVQVYFDFRRDGRGDRNFAPGVAAYVFAPDDAKERVTVKQIAGNREISNRGARAPWFSVEGIVARCRPWANGYELEVRIPYGSMGVEPPRTGDVIGFDLSVSDNDGTWYRNTQMLWSGSRGRRCYIRGSYHDPGEFGTLIVGELG